ncbi:SOS response-associated peptidase [Lactobacillus helveticus]|nr:SOS response-associated peptidase [Lactobacillus helveticus]
MCGRYYIDVRRNKRLHQLTESLAGHNMPVKTGEVFPKDHAAVIMAHAQHMALGQLIINARSETVLIKEMFKAPFLNERCVFPMSGFYEWSKDKGKTYFQDPQGRILLVAGFIAHFPEGKRSIILTTTPNDAVARVHDRMPLMIPHKDLKKWLFDDTYAVAQLWEEMAELISTTNDSDAVLS